MPRNPLLAKLHIARKDLALAEECYRAILTRITGQDSGAGLTDAQLAAVLAEFRRLGWQASKAASTAPRYRPKSSKDYVAKIFAIWTDMGRLGLLKDPSRAALISFVRGMSAVDDPNWLEVGPAIKVIEGLKSWRARELARRDAGGRDG